MAFIIPIIVAVVVIALVIVALMLMYKVADVDKAVDELVAALEDAGINDVIADNQAQLNAFLGK